MMVRRLLALAFFLVAQTACAQFGDKVDTHGARNDKAATQKIKIGIVVTAVGGPVAGLVGTAPVPFDWPEQTVKVDKEDLSPGVQKIEYKTLNSGVKQMIIHIPTLPAGQEAHALVTFEVTRYSQLPPSDTSLLSIPKKVDREMGLFLGPSPFIESRNQKIIDLAKATIADKQTDWEKVEAIYDKVREKVVYKEGPLKGALKGLIDGTGDCEEITSLFIAMCRADNIPARSVWVDGHCYPEFYLVDGEGKGYWIPCQSAGSRAFGGIPEHRPILQKGDNFMDPMRPNERLRYVSEFVRGASHKGGGQPHVKFVRELVSN
ncbi:MAG TPA: transglutaminase-like domain-containing protein [Pirellulales bacterium]|nr:transglutaminase-like domain-containing protein [Pirellulales bacterium]